MRAGQGRLDLVNLGRAGFGNLGLVVLAYGLLLLALFGPTPGCGG